MNDTDTTTTCATCGEPIHLINGGRGPYRHVDQTVAHDHWARPEVFPNAPEGGR